jgi:hypothetical protein
VAGLFLALTAAAAPPATAAALALPAVAGGLAAAALWPEGGTEAFVATAFWPHLALCAAAVALLDPRVRRAGLLYLALLGAVFAVPDPVGQNAARLGALAGPALLALAPRPHAPRAVVVVVCAGLVYLQWLPAVRAVVEAHGDPSTRAGFHAELVDVARRELGPGERVEVVFTRNHWEAAHVAPAVPIARGWSRQRDRAVNALFYDEAPLTPARYRAWLRARRVGLVALPAAPLDHSARAEAALVERAPAYLAPVHRSTRWRVWAVDG